ncbi:hypothetical protein Xoosp13_100 [Xanthomonas phage Xoo-sp13]|nr:hypothetical protein Xoosp13_100 [Xanthomonas phage Xoo-sp13]
MTTEYTPPETISVDDLPFPRLELRWREQDETEHYYNWVCDYFLVLAPRTVSDIRSSTYVDDNEKFHTTDVEYLLASSQRKSVREPYPGDTPYRDGSHAGWDSCALNIPAYVTYKGVSVLVPNKERV